MVKDNGLVCPTSPEHSFVPHGPSLLLLSPAL